MARLSDWLYRLRPSGAPGSATAAGVPADRRRSDELELEPVFAELAATEEVCRGILERGRDDAARVRARYAAEVEQTLAAAAGRVAGERATAANRVAAAGAAHRGVIDREADRQSYALRGRLETMLPAYRESFAASLRAVLDDDGALSTSMTTSGTPTAVARDPS
jgi:hypothetical protein